MKLKIKLAIGIVFLVPLTAEIFFRFESTIRSTTNQSGGKQVTAQKGRFLSIPTEFAPYTDGFNVTNFRSENVNTNSHGFRTLKEVGGKLPGDKRIFVLGGSAAAGWGATSDDTTFSLVTEKLLQQSGFRQTYIFNGGCDGFNSNQEWVLTATKIMDLKPDLVILFDGYNDMHFSMGERWTEDYNIYSAQTLKLMSFHPWYLHSALLRTIAERTKKHRIRAQYVGKEGLFRPEFMDLYLRNINKIANASHSIGAKTLVLLQPHFMIAERPLTASEKLIHTTGHDVNMFTNYSDLIDKDYKISRKTLEARSRNALWEYQDANEFFKDKTDMLFLDEVHLSDQGHLVVAENLSRIIQERGLLNFGPSKSSSRRGVSSVSP